jgi:hypothetical protein
MNRSKYSREAFEGTPERMAYRCHDFMNQSCEAALMAGNGARYSKEAFAKNR